MFVKEREKIEKCPKNLKLLVYRKFVVVWISVCLLQIFRFKFCLVGEKRSYDGI